MFTYIIVDDGKITRTGTKIKLEPMAEEVKCIGEASNGAEALQMIEELQPDIVITDMQMPVMDGRELLTILMERFPKLAIIVISAYQNFDYARYAVKANAVDYLLKPFTDQEIQAVMRKTLEQRRDHKAKETLQTVTMENYIQTKLLRDKELLQHMLEGYTGAKAELQSTHLKNLFDEHSQCLVQLWSPLDIDQPKLEEFLRIHPYSDTLLYLPHMHAGNIGFLFLSLPEDQAEQGYRYVQQILESLNGFFWNQRQAVVYGCSRTYQHFTQLSVMLQETVAALNRLTVDFLTRYRETAGSGDRQSFLTGKSGLLKDNICICPEQMISACHVVWEQTDQLLFCIESGREEETTRLVGELFDYFLSRPELRMADMKNYCSSLFNEIRYMLSSYIPELSVPRNELSVRSIMDTLFSLEELKAYELRFFLNITRQLAPKQIYGDKDVVNNVITYVDRYYYKNLTVEFVASLFYMNRTYLSHIFRKRSGRSFVDYLNAVRIEHACQLLQQTDTKVYQIAKTVGYNNLRHFERSFKKVTGKTPEQYRN